MLALAINPLGTELAAGGEDGVVRTWHLPSGEPKRSDHMHGAHGVVFTLVYDQDSRHLFSSGGGGSDESSEAADALHVAIRWDTETGDEDYRIKPKRTGAMTLAVSPSADRLLTGGYDGDLVVWDIPSRKKVGVLGQHESQVACIAFSPKRRHLATASNDRVIKLWDASRLDEQQEGEVILRCKGKWFPQMGFDPDGRLLVVGDGNDVLVYDVSARRVILPLEGHGDTVNGSVFSDDGRLIASGSTDGTVKLWDAKTGELLETLLAEAAVYRVAFTPDGGWLVTAGEDSTVKLWNLSFLKHDEAASAAE